jgi:hypothetical protein
MKRSVGFPRGQKSPAKLHIQLSADNPSENQIIPMIHRLYKIIHLFFLYIFIHVRPGEEPAL